MKQKILGMMIVFFLLCLLPASCFAQEPGGEGPQIPDGWTQVVDEAPITAQEFKNMTLPDYIEKGVSAVKENMRAPLRLLAKLCGLLLLCSVAKSLCGEKASSEIASLLDTVITLAAFTLCTSSLLALLGVLQQAVETSRVYIMSFVPVFASALVSCGQVGGATLYSGFFFGAATLIANLLCNIGLPATRVLLALNATAAVESTLDLSALSSAICKWTKWLLTLCATVFGALIGLQGVLAQSADTLALKTGKFILGSSIPVVGRAVSDAMGSVLAGLKLLKGTVGFAVIAVVACAFIPVLLQCCVYHIVFSVGNAVAAATGNGKSAKLFSGLADCVSVYISMIFFFSFIVIVSTLMMILLGSGG